jgi:hypothetical protein
MSFVRKKEETESGKRKITCLGEGNELCQKRRGGREWKVIFLMRKITCLGEGNELCQKEEWKVVFLMPEHDSHGRQPVLLVQSLVNI